MTVPRCTAALAALGLVFVPAYGVLGSVAAQTPPTRVPDQLERLAAQPDARTTWSRFIRRLDGQGAVDWMDDYAIISAVVVESPGTATRTSGIKIELRHEGTRPERCELGVVPFYPMCEGEREVAYIDARRLDSLRARLLQGHAVEVFEVGRFDIAKYDVGSMGTGLWLLGYHLHGRSLRDFGRVVADAQRVLLNTPR